MTDQVAWTTRQLPGKKKDTFVAVVLSECFTFSPAQWALPQLNGPVQLYVLHVDNTVYWVILAARQSQEKKKNLRLAHLGICSLDPAWHQVPYDFFFFFCERLSASMARSLRCIEP